MRENDDADDADEGDMDEALDMDEAELADDVFKSVGLSGTGLRLLPLDNVAPFFLCSCPS